jgi:hypothetical protein
MSFELSLVWSCRVNLQAVIFQIQRTGERLLRGLISSFRFFVSAQGVSLM